jgi:dipeptidyl aminopeptidase/acylaminoacyl peptidase
MKMRWYAMMLAVAIAGPAIARETPTSRYLTAASLDGRYRAEVSTMRPVYNCDAEGRGDSDNTEHVLTVTDTRTGKQNFVFVGLRGIRIYAAETRPYDQWPDSSTFGSPKFSPDGRTVYLVMRDTLCDTQSWKDKPRVYRVAVDGQVEHFVIKGRLLAIVRDGPRAGYLIVQQRRADAERGRGDPVLLASPDGKPVLTIPGSEAMGQAAITPWLKKQGWTSY